MPRPAAAPASARPVTRRRALAAGSAAAAALAAGPFVRASDKAGAKAVTVGSGDHVYEWRGDWARLPDGFAWGNTHGVCQSTDGTIFVCHQAESGLERDVVLAFDPDGRFLRSWGEEYHGGGHGLDLRVEDGTEYLYLTELKTPSTVKYALDGEKVRDWKKPEGTDEYGPDVRYMATNVAFTPDGGFFVGDGYGSSFLIKYDAAGELAGVFGGQGTEPGKLNCPHGLLWDGRPRREPALAVADRANNRLSYFDIHGAFLRVEAKNTVPAPCDLDAREKIAVVPDLNARVSLLDENDDLVTHLGATDESVEKALADGRALRKQPGKWVPGEFVAPHDAAFVNGGDLLVAEWVPSGRLTYLKRA